MDDRLREHLREAGEELSENHDSDTIEAVIDDVENLDSEDSEKTAEILRIMNQR